MSGKLATTAAQRLLARLWWSRARRFVEALSRRLARRPRIVAGPLRGARFHGGLAQRLGVYELPAQEALLDGLRPGAVCYDVGGHNGYMSLLAARAVGPRGMVFTFEPLAANRRRILKALEDNSIANVHLQAAAVAEDSGKAWLFLSAGQATTTASLIPGESAEATGSAEEVATLRLDDFVRDHPLPALVKVDVEGAEGRVLAGAEALLASEAPPAWLIEIHDADNEGEVRQRLEAEGYELRRIASLRPESRPYPHHLLAVPGR